MRAPMVMASWKRLIEKYQRHGNDQVDYLSAIEEGEFVIAQASVAVDESGSWWKVWYPADIKMNLPWQCLIRAVYG